LSDLFRSQAIEAKQSRWTGEVSSIRPVKVWVPVLFLTVISVFAVAFLFLGSYSRKERVSGVIVSAEGVIRVRSPESAVISAIPVRDGQEIHAGDLLVELSRERFSVAGPTSELVDQSLGLQREQIIRQTREQQAATLAAAKGIEDRVGRAKRDLLHIDEEMRLQEQGIASTERVVANLKPLAEDRIISDLQYQQQVTQLLDQKGRLQSLKRAREALQAEIQSAQTDLASLIAKSQAEAAGSERTRLVLEQDRLQRRSDSALQLRSPVSGTVTSLLGVIGQRVEPATLIAAIVPADATLQAVLFVPSTAIGFVRTGRRVTLRYDAFPFEKFGQYSGTVTKVSEVDVPAADLEAPTLIGKDKNLYRVRVSLDREQIEAYGSAVKLRPGLTLSADIELDRRRLVEWIFDPLFALGKKL
jgi:membrane fusion protein